MKALMLSGVLAAGLGVGLLAPATAEAGHHHSRYCGHGYGGYARGRGYYAPAPYYGAGYYRPYPAYGAYYGHRHYAGCGHGGYGYGYGGYGYGGYGYGYAPGYVVAPPPPGYCVRPGVSIHLGF